jgi:N-acetylglucosamine-6-phosphate deacetylase
MLIQNGLVLHNDWLEPESDTRIEGDRVTAIEPGLVPRTGEEVIDAEGHYVLPGLIDLHTHGLREVHLQEGGWIDYARYQTEYGVTSCLPTLFGAPDAITRAMETALHETDAFRRTPNLLGFRLEMPYLTKSGAGQESAPVAINDETTGKLWATSQRLVRVWDVSPELDGAIPFIRWATKHDIVTSLAHSEANVELTRRAIEAGLSLVTHFYDTFDLAEQTDPGVYPAGLTDYIQIENRLIVEIIPDGVHVHPFLVEKTFRCKGLDRIAFVTDSVRGAGSPPGIYAGLYPGVQVAVTPDRGVRRLPDDTLSGSALTQLRSFQNAVRRFGRSISEASALCSRTPARVLGLRNKGYLTAGMDADVIILDQSLHLKATIIGGRVAYRAEGFS